MKYDDFKKEFNKIYNETTANAPDEMADTFAMMFFMAQIAFEKQRMKQEIYKSSPKKNIVRV